METLGLEHNAANVTTTESALFQLVQVIKREKKFRLKWMLSYLSRMHFLKKNF